MRSVASAELTYPFTPMSNVKLRPGQFWGHQLSDGRYACSRVLGIPPGSRSRFIVGVLDWISDNPPTEATIAGAGILEIGDTDVKWAFGKEDEPMLGFRALEDDGIEPVTKALAYFSPKPKAEWHFLHSSEPRKWGRRDVASPLTPEMLEPFGAETGVVQFKSLLTDADFLQLAAWLEAYPQLTLRAYGSYDRSITDLEFLRFFPSLKRFSGDVLHALTSLDGLRHLPENVESLAIGETKRSLDLSILGRFDSLKTLYLEGQGKAATILPELVSLEDLTLRSITLPDLSALLPLRNLLALDLKLGGTSDLSLLPQVGELRYIELWMIRGLTDLAPISALRHLRFLFLQSLRRVEALPDFSANTELCRIHIESMKGLTNLDQLASAHALEQLMVIDMPQLRAEDFRCLLAHPSLKNATVGLGSFKKNDAVTDLLGLPSVEDRSVNWRDL